MRRARPLVVAVIAVAVIAAAIAAAGFAPARAQAPADAPTVATQITQPGRTVGDPILFTVTVRYGPGVTLEVPAGVVDVEPLEPAAPIEVQRESHADDGSTLTITYLTRSFTTGRLLLQPPQLPYHDPAGLRQTLVPPPLTIEIVSVLPADAPAITLLPSPLKPALPLADAEPPWVVIGAALGGIALLGGGLALRRRRRAAPSPAVLSAAPPPAPAEAAAAELEGVGALGLDAAQIEEYYARINAVVRRYLATEYQVPAFNLATHELPDRLLQAGADLHTATLVRTLCGEYDTVTYGRALPLNDRAVRFLELAWEIVQPPVTLPFARPGASAGRWERP